MNARTTANTLTLYGTSFYDVTLNAASTTTSLGADLVVSNLLYIAGTNTLAATGAARTVTFSGSSSTLGLQCEGAITQTTNAVKIACTSGTTTLSGGATNTSYVLGDINFSGTAILQAPSSGTVDIGLQAATITVGSTATLNFVNGSGVVNTTVIDLASITTANTVTLTNSAGGSMTFNNLTIIGSNATYVSTLQSASSGTNLINIKGNLVRTGGTSNTNFSTSNSSGTLDVTMNGNTTQNLPTGNFRNLTIANTADSVITTGNLTITTSGNKKLTINSGARLVLKNNLTFTSNTSNAPDSVIVNGFLRQSSSVTIAGGGTGNSVLFVSGTGTYEHSINSGTIPTATWATNSTCLITGTAGSLPTGFGQSFFNVTFNCPNISSGRNLAGALTSVAGTLSVISTGSGSIRLNNSLDVSQVDYIGNIANMSVSGGIL